MMLPSGENTLRLLMEPFAPHLALPGTTEIVVNKPHEIGRECDGGWTWHSAPGLDFDHLDALATLAAARTLQDFGPHFPRCSSALPGGYRVQISRPPISAPGTISLTIRKRATSFVPTLEWLADHGCFAELDRSVDWVERLTGYVRNLKTMLIAGKTGSGKTTVCEALCRAIPLDERLLTIEKEPELADLPHRGWLPQYYGFAGDGEAAARAAVSMLEDALRQRPDRVLFGELRLAGEAVAYLRCLKAGHGGGITTLHSGSARGAIPSLAIMMRGDPGYASMQDSDIRTEISQHVDVLMHCARKPYRITEVVEVEHA